MKVRYEVKTNGNILGLEGITQRSQLIGLLVKSMKAIGFYVQENNDYVVVGRDGWLYLLPKKRIEYYGCWKIPFDFVEEAAKGKKFRGTERRDGLQYFYITGGWLNNYTEEVAIRDAHRAAVELGDAGPDNVLGLWRI